MHVGIDLDNTLIDYGRVFGPVSVDLGVLPASMVNANKATVREFLRASGPKGNELWMRVQGQVYGRYLEQASFMAGADQTLSYLREMGAKVSIVSHKTKVGHFDENKVDLQQAALKWLEHRKFFADDGFALRPENVHFLETRDEKINRITEIDCDVFIDDLPEVLTHPYFPEGVRRIWFVGGQEHSDGSGLERYASWDDIRTRVLRPLLQGEGA